MSSPVHAAGCDAPLTAFADARSKRASAAARWRRPTALRSGAARAQGRAMVRATRRRLAERLGGGIVGAKLAATNPAALQKLGLAKPIRCSARGCSRACAAPRRLHRMRGRGRARGALRRRPAHLTRSPRRRRGVPGDRAGRHAHRRLAERATGGNPCRHGLLRCAGHRRAVRRLAHARPRRRFGAPAGQRRGCAPGLGRVGDGPPVRSTGRVR